MALAAALVLLDLAYLAIPLWDNLFVQGGESEALPPFLRLGPTSIFLRALLFLTSLILFLAGLMTVLRRRVGRRLHVLFSVLAVFTILCSIAYAVRMHRQTGDWASTHPDNEIAAWFTGFDGSIYPWVALAVGIVLALAWPVVCFVWFAVLRREPDAGMPPRPLPPVEPPRATSPI